MIHYLKKSFQLAQQRLGIGYFEDRLRRALLIVYKIKQLKIT